MAGFRQFLKSGHTPTLFAAFFYLMFSFVIWVMNGAMAPFISEQFQLTASQKGLLLSIPIVAGAIMRFPLGLLAQYVGRKTATMVELTLITFTMSFGYFFVHTYDDLLKMALLLGVAGASFGVAMSLGSGWYPPKYKGLAMGLVGAGNAGTALAALLAPPLAQAYGWQAVYGFAGLASLVPMAVVLFMAKEPPDRDEHAGMREHLACLMESDGWVFSLIYVVTFGGFIGIVTFLPTYYYDQFGVSKVQAGQLTMLAALMGAVVRVAGGWISDRFGRRRSLALFIFGTTLPRRSAGAAWAQAAGAAGRARLSRDKVACRRGSVMGGLVKGFGVQKRSSAVASSHSARWRITSLATSRRAWLAARACCSSASKAGRSPAGWASASACATKTPALRPAPRAAAWAK